MPKRIRYTPEEWQRLPVMTQLSRMDLAPKKEEELFNKTAGKLIKLLEDKPREKINNMAATLNLIKEAEKELCLEDMGALIDAMKLSGLEIYFLLSEQRRELESKRSNPNRVKKKYLWQMALLELYVKTSPIKIDAFCLEYEYKEITTKNKEKIKLPAAKTMNEFLTKDKIEVYKRRQGAW